MKVGNRGVELEGEQSTEKRNRVGEWNPLVVRSGVHRVGDLHHARRSVEEVPHREWVLDNRVVQRMGWGVG